MNINCDNILFKAIVNYHFYDIDTLKDKYIFQTESDCFDALDEL